MFRRKIEYAVYEAESEHRCHDEQKPEYECRAGNEEGAFIAQGCEVYEEESQNPANYLVPRTNILFHVELEKRPFV